MAENNDFGTVISSTTAMYLGGLFDTPVEPSKPRSNGRLHEQPRERKYPAIARATTLTAAIYLRISDPKQRIANQLPVLERICQDRGWKIVDVYEDAESGKLGPEKRPEFARMLADAESGKWGVLVFWALDRISRQGAFVTLGYLDRLTKNGVKYVSAQEPFLDSGGPFGEVILTLPACVAKLERERHSERTKAGIAHRRTKGAYVGRTPRMVALDKLKLCIAAGFSHNQVAKVFAISRSTAADYVRLFKTGNLAEIERRNAIAADVAGRKARVEEMKP